LKSNTTRAYQDVERVKKEWMSFAEFKGSVNLESISSSGENWQYLKEVINSISEDFYSKNLMNKTNSTFEDFLKTKSKELEWWITEEVSSNEILSKVLPAYSEVVSDPGEWFLTDFKFINYVETVMDTFDLSYNNPIWISGIKVVENYSVGNADTSLETNIYSIPITFDLVGKKTNILDFLYFVSNVWKISVEGVKNNELKLDTNIDKDFRTSFLRRVLKWAKAGENIFENQISDIESVSFGDYIDSPTSYAREYGLSYASSLTFINYLKANSANDEYKVTVKLVFYVKWLPIYKIENYIQWFVKDFNVLKSQVAQTIQNSNIWIVDKQKLNEITKSLDQTSKTVLPNIQKWLWRKDSINEAYNLVNSYYNTLKDYESILNQIKNTLDPKNNELWNTAK
jgi:hypothetical protein